MHDMQLLCQPEGCVATKLSFSHAVEDEFKEKAKRQRNKTLEHQESLQ